jgi:hypothetical protein
MTVECDAMPSSDDFSFQDFDLDYGILNGRRISWIDPRRDDEEIRNLLLKSADDLLRRSALHERIRAGRWQRLDIVKIDLANQKGLIARSFFSKLWKKNKKTIMFVAAALAAVAVVGIVAAVALGAAAAASGSSDQKPDDPAKGNPPPEDKTPPAVSLPSPSNPAMQSAPMIAPLKEAPGLAQRNLIPDIQPIPSAINIFNSIGNPSSIPPYQPMLSTMLPVSSKTIDPLPDQMPPGPLISQTLLDPPQLPALGASSPAIKTTFVSDYSYKTPPPPASSPAKQSWIADFLKTIGHGLIDPDLMNPNTLLPSAEISSTFTTGGTKNLRLGIGGINGMNTSLNEAANHANYLAQFAPNQSINWVHNCTHGPLADLAEIFSLNYAGQSPNTAPLLQKEWEAFHQANADCPNAKYLQICHSQGAIHVRNALMQSPKEIRDRVIVIAIAPAVILTEEDCFKARNFACKGDVVPSGELAYLGFFDGDRDGTSKAMESAMERQKTIIWVDPLPNTQNVHDFQNPAFMQILKDEIEDHLSCKGEYK